MRYIKKFLRGSAHETGGLELMPVKIRLARGGRKKRPFYKIVVASSEAPRDGRFIERIGTYDPLPMQTQVQIDNDRLQYWLRQGAKPTDTVRNLIQRYGKPS
jgi:small subunit ribosomal protein S16